MKRTVILALVLLMMCVGYCACSRRRSETVNNGEIYTITEKTTSYVDTSVLDSAAFSSESGMTDTASDQSKADWREIEIAPSAGSYASISFQIPDDWDYCMTQSEDVPVSDICVSIYPKALGDSEGVISIMFSKEFGICGTGLHFEEITFNGLTANLGTFMDNPYWSWIFLHPPYSGCVIHNDAGDTWYSEYKDEVEEILSTVKFALVDIGEGGFLDE